MIRHRVWAADRRARLLWYDRTPVHRLAFSVLSLALIAACEPYTNTVSLAPTTTPDSINFRINGPGGPATGVFGLSVVRCGTEYSQWTIATDGSKPIPQVVTFGQPIVGFDVRTPAQHLGPGCYDVLVSGARPLRINVGHDGAVTSP